MGDAASALPLFRRHERTHKTAHCRGNVGLPVVSEGDRHEYRKQNQRDRNDRPPHLPARKGWASAGLRRVGGRGLGAAHQTGWTGLIAFLMAWCGAARAEPTPELAPAYASQN